LNHSMEISYARAAEYDGVFYPGGHGPMWDLATDKVSANLIGEFAMQGKCIGAVCHAPAAFLQVQLQGVAFLSGKKLTGFSNAEEELLGLTNEMPFLLEDALSDAGANYVCGKPFEPFVVADGMLVTGQNAASSIAAASEFIKRLRSKTGGF